jgi:hypothetical protein
MAIYDITLHGCDDQLTFQVQLFDQDPALLQRIARMSEDLHSGCEPYMTVTEHEEEVPF